MTDYEYMEEKFLQGLVGIYIDGPAPIDTHPYDHQPGLSALKHEVKEWEMAKKAVMDGLWTGFQGVLIGEEFAPWGIGCHRVWVTPSERGKALSASQ